MGSKSIMFVGIFLAMAVLISSQGNELEPYPTSPSRNNPPPTGGLCKYGCCGRSSYTNGCICCTRRGQQPFDP